MIWGIAGKELVAKDSFFFFPDGWNTLFPLKYIFECLLCFRNWDFSEITKMHIHINY